MPSIKHKCGPKTGGATETYNLDGILTAEATRSALDPLEEWENESSDHWSEHSFSTQSVDCVLTELAVETGFNVCATEHGPPHKKTKGSTHTAGRSSTRTHPDDILPDANGEEDPDEYSDERDPGKGGKRPRQNGRPTLRFACPFYKHDRNKYAECKNWSTADKLRVK
jgi:hypothetical protein